MKENIQTSKPKKYANYVGVVLAQEVNIESKPLLYNPI